MSYAQATAVTGGDGSWSADLIEGWDIFGVTNGGYTMSIATRAMAAETADRELISATGTFLNPANPGPVGIQVSTLKRGRSLSTLRGEVIREGKTLVIVSGVFADGDRPRPEQGLIVGGPPQLPPPGECVPTEPSQTGPLPPPFTGKVEIRLHPEDARFTEEKTGSSSVRGWFRLRGGEGIDANAVVMAADSFPPAIFNSGLPIGWTPTIELSVQVREPHPVGWLACVFITRFATAGMLEEDGEIWDEQGRLVALSRQLALVPR